MTKEIPENRSEKKSLANVANTISSLDLPNIFDFDSLVKNISSKIKQEIEFIPCTMIADTTGMVVSGEKIHIFFEANVSPIHQVQIKLHELGHIILGHIADVNKPDKDETLILQSFFTSVEDYKKQQVVAMNRRDYDSASEKEAEFFATELIGRVRLDTYAVDDPVFSVCFK